MSRKPASPLFLQQTTYRQRRLRDGIRLLPLLAIILWCIPLAWPRGTGLEQVRSEGAIYVFGVWVAVIVLGAVLTRRMRDTDHPEGADDKNL